MVLLTISLATTRLSSRYNQGFPPAVQAMKMPNALTMALTRYRTPWTPAEESDGPPSSGQRCLAMGEIACTRQGRTEHTALPSSRALSAPFPVSIVTEPQTFSARPRCGGKRARRGEVWWSALLKTPVRSSRTKEAKMLNRIASRLCNPVE